MITIDFEQAMRFMRTQTTGDARKLNLFFRNYCSNEFELELTVKDALYYTSAFKEITKKCYEIAGESLAKNTKGDFDKQVFNNYPKLSEEFKSKWVNDSYMSVFR